MGVKRGKDSDHEEAARVSVRPAPLSSFFAFAAMSIANLRNISG